jgi:hypothetical protein
VVNVVPEVTANVNLPDRKTESEISRNEAGDITKVIQTETTLQ